MDNGVVFNPFGFNDEFPEEIKKHITDAAAVTVGEESIHIGAGLAHMTGLLQMVEHANEAGADIPYIILRDSDNQRKSIHLQSQVRSVLAAAAERENIVESAHNVVMASYALQARIRDDKTNSLEDREAAAEKAHDFVENYKTHLETLISKYDPDVLPVDLDTLQSVYAERLEAAATGRQKYLKDALTQQAIDNWATCVDMDQGMTKIAQAHRLGYIEIMRADSTTKAQAAFDAAVEAINAVEILNVASWRFSNKDYENGDSVETTSRSLTLTCVQAGGVDGNVTVLYPDITDGNGKKATPLLFARLPVPGQSDQNISLILNTLTPLPITVRLKGINLCGPSAFTIKVVAPPV